MPGRRSSADARDTRATVLRRAADIGSVDGLEGITIGRLASDLGMSKAGVIGQFGSKEELQLATVGLATDLFRTHVWEPAATASPGMSRLLAICDSWCAYADDPPFPGGCFLTTTALEFAGRSGQVHDALSRALRLWNRTLVADICTAIASGELPADTPPEQLAFLLTALVSEVKSATLLRGETAASLYAWRGMLAALGRPRPNDVPPHARAPLAVNRTPRRSRVEHLTPSA